MKPFLQLLLLALATTAVAAPSDPVGALRLLLRGNSDTVVSLPLQRPPLAEAELISCTGNDLVLDTTAIPALPAGGAYILVMTGALEGAALPISATSETTATVLPGSFDLTALQPGDLADVIPYWTLDTLFPAGAGVHPTTNGLMPKSLVLTYDHAHAGKNPATFATYYYYSGAGMVGPGWYKTGVSGQLAGTTALPPYLHFVVRHNLATNTDLLLTGSVQLSALRIPLSTLAANTDQDNLVSWPVPLATTLDDSGLITSGAFRATTNPLLPNDLLYLFDSVAIGKNKAPAFTYYYYQGTGLQGAGWYKVGDTTQRTDQKLLTPGEGMIIRKKRTVTPVVQPWTALPSFLQ